MARSGKARVALDIVVVGAGLAGMATAFSLSRAGHRVVVIEKSDGKARSYGSVVSSPNMTRIIQSWGVQDELDRMAVLFNRIHHYEAETGVFLGALTQGILDEIKKDAVHGFAIFPYGELLDLFHQLASKKGTKFRFNETVVSLEPDTPCVILESGERVCADLIVGADGFHSTIRSYVADGAQELESDARVVQLRTTIPLAKIREDRDFDDIGGPLDWDWWLGNGYICHCSVTQTQDQDMTVVIVHPYHEIATSENKEWHRTQKVENYGVSMDKMEPRLRKLVGMADSFAVRVYESPAVLESLVGPSSKVILVGEAAHHSMPSGYHLTAMGIEDAQTLGRLFSRIQRKDQIGQIATAYDEIRQPRAEFIHHYEKQYQTVLRVPKGPVQVVRDTCLQKLSEFAPGNAADEEMILQMWGGELQIITHDATEKVDDWWSQYGTFIWRASMPPPADGDTRAT
ncbi:hypothetical protein CPB83DRAFT_852380 [Crepidotus variabilis]|uniref:FAD-binding domain-containing protein n=1 Tax=Crepidotus variabilis TaxID=179855 RepID=A0A9P6JRI4_9AGAR|nr:hypothetical protein CPB83DRAFT_852380 [Crepidotus variabilis]